VSYDIFQVLCIPKANDYDENVPETTYSPTSDLQGPLTLQYSQNNRVGPDSSNIFISTSESEILQVPDRFNKLSWQRQPHSRNILDPNKPVLLEPLWGSTTASGYRVGQKVSRGQTFHREFPPSLWHHGSRPTSSFSVVLLAVLLIPHSCRRVVDTRSVSGRDKTPILKNCLTSGQDPELRIVRELVLSLAKDCIYNKGPEDNKRSAKKTRIVVIPDGKACDWCGDLKV
jgi:hypothetical protein